MAGFTLRPALVLAALLPGAAMAGPLVLNLPQPAKQTVQAVSVVSDLLLPSGAFADGAIPGARLPGRVSQTAWRIGQPLATVDLMTRLKADVLAAGFEVTFDCQTQDCGGYDFRYALPVLPEPDMHVDLGDFRFLAARRGDEGVTLLVSRSRQAAYAQITLVGPQVAARLFYTGERIGGEQMLELGLADELVPDGDVRARAQALALKIAQSAPLAVQSTRATLCLGLADAVQAANAREWEISERLRTIFTPPTSTRFAGRSLPGSARATTTPRAAA